MTIVAAVKSRDGLVLGTDSMTQVTAVNPADPTAAPQYLISYANATKLFRIGEYPMAAVTWGSGNIGNRSISGIVLDFEGTLSVTPTTVEQVANELCEYVGAMYDATFSAVPEENRPILGFLLGGYSPGQPLAELWEIRFPIGQSDAARVHCMRDQEASGANWRGIEIPFTRVHFGFDPRIIDKLVSTGMKAEQAIGMLSGFETPVIFDSMPVQDAIDFTKHILRTTISYSTFEIGLAACGEPLQIGVLLRKGFKWVEEPKFHL